MQETAPAISSREDVVNIATVLIEQAHTRPNAIAMYYPVGRRNRMPVYAEYSYAQLNRDSDAMAHGLRSVGITRGVRTVLMVKPSTEFFALSFAIAKLGAVPVMVDPGMGIKNLGTCLAEAEPEAFIGIAKAHIARALFGWGRASIRTKICVGGPHWPGCHRLKRLQQLGERSDNEPVLANTSASDDAAILFTSGSTGVPKGALYSHGNFAAQVDILRDLSGIQPGEIDLPTFPLFALFDPALGMTTVIPDMNASRPATVDPRRLLFAIEQFGVTNIFASPAVLKRLADHCAENDTQLTSLRRVVCAGAPVPAGTMARMQAALTGGAEIITPYGATEALPVAAIGSREVLGETRAKTERGDGICVGPSVKDMTIEIIAISDDPIEDWQDSLLVPDGTIGEVVATGPTVTRSYFHRPAATLAAKINRGAGVICHRMGDLGYLDEIGRLWFCGRKNHRVILDDETLFTIPVEAIFNTHPKLFRSALVGVGEGSQRRAILCIELESGVSRTEHETIFGELKALGQSHKKTQSVCEFLVHPGFPVDVRHNSKIVREELAPWAEGQLS
ncbi:MAG: AMP-binding protein [Polyangiaceae bacterium]|nr:AMP-binding protein [Polyangiaceae bacterium]